MARRCAYTVSARPSTALWASCGLCGAAWSTPPRIPGTTALVGSTGSPGQDPEERLDVRVGPRVPVAVEVGAAGARRRRAVASQAREKALNIRVGAHVPVAVEV